MFGTVVTGTAESDNSAHRDNHCRNLNSAIRPCAPVVRYPAHSDAACVPAWLPSAQGVHTDNGGVRFLSGLPMSVQTTGGW